ncbi:hypothetical protein B0A52_04429 [Exophiala mesophila]|uniref:N-terminal of MaoC-like dehydratase domain-containing protein n=1 Tax=Exophiala mesophila TaxID=212818 RepID=A0A438N8Z8_EXOME|nr:hypothetical protein B0A52_04429 [Exophiala mesophila]
MSLHLSRISRGKLTSHGGGSCPIVGQSFFRGSPNTSYDLAKSRRHQFSTTTRCQQSKTADPQAIATAFLEKFSNGQSFVRRQLLDANQLRLFSLTLNRAHLWPSSEVLRAKTLEEVEPKQGTPVPAGYHLAYFTPAQLPGVLGLDGTDASFNPEAPFTRRMWAGGECEWPGAGPVVGGGAGSDTRAYLRVGEVATEVTKVLSCEVKRIKKTGEDMLVVGVEKEFRNGKDELCVLDRRNWVFRPAFDPAKPAPQVAKPDELSKTELEQQAQGKIVRHYNRDETTLFRFSALTFNGHRIHYDKPWATQVEGHRNIVVHGPLNLIAMLDLWRDETLHQGVGSGRGGGGAEGEAEGSLVYPKKVEYRATSPVYAGEGYRVMMNDDAVGSQVAEVQVISDDGTVCMKGKISDW